MEDRIDTTQEFRHYFLTPRTKELLDDLVWKYEQIVNRPTDYEEVLDYALRRMNEK